MQTYTLTLTQHRENVTGTIELIFNKPLGFLYLAGQYTTLRVPTLNQPDPRGNCRVFSIASAPFEENVRFAFRRGKSGYKDSLEHLTLGQTANITTPKGNFVLNPAEDRPAVFLAGGIGVTPARSMILQALHDQLSRELWLFYSNRQPDSSAYLHEFQAIKDIRFKMVATMTDMEQSKIPWTGETGFIDAAKILKYLPDPHLPTYFLVGPPSFVDAMDNLLRSFNVQDSHIHKDKFTGY